MPRTVDNEGSAARDFCMLERNLLANLKLALLLSLVSSSVLLRARLPTPAVDGSRPHSSRAGVPMATVQMIASLAVIGGAYWEYHSNMKAMRNMRAFLFTNSHLALVSVVAGIIFTTTVVLLGEQNEL